MATKKNTTKKNTTKKPVVNKKETPKKETPKKEEPKKETPKKEEPKENLVTTSKDIKPSESKVINVSKSPISAYVFKKGKWVKIN